MAFSTEREMLGEEGSSEMLQELGTVGWNDTGDIYDPGVNGGPTYVRVTLYKGRDITQPKKPGRAEGMQIVCRVPSGSMGLPTRNTEVLVAFPGGFSGSPGAGVIIAALSRVSSAATYGNIKEGDLCLHAGDADAKSRILIKQTGTISIVSVANADGSTMAIVINPADGSVHVISPKTAMSLDNDGATIISGDSGMKLGNDGTVSVNCKKFVVNAGQQIVLNSATVLLGVGAVAASPANAAIKGPSGISGTASTQVWIAV